MSAFPIHTIESAPVAAKDLLRGAKKNFGFVPNLLGELADAPPALAAYLTLHELLGQTSLSPVEQNVTLLSASRTNECEYCVAAHTAGLKQAGLADDQIEALRAGEALDDPKLDALSRFTTAVVQRRGYLDPEDVQAFLDGGYERRQILEVLVAVAMKTLSNYTNHIVGTPLDEPLKQFAWEGQTA